MVKPSVILFALTFGLAYFFIEKAGLFSVSTLSCVEILFSKPVLAASVLMLIITLAGIYRNFRNAGIAGWLQVVSILLLISGLWVSYLTRFSGEAVITEGQTFYTAQSDYLPETLYRGRFSKIPDIGLILEKLDPVFSEDGKDIQALSGNVLIIDKDSGTGTEYTLTDGFPGLITGALLKLRDFGYSPRYVLKSNIGRVLDSSFMYMRLFPPGSEDNFRLLSPLTYYVRYYPAGSNENEEPLIGLRIVRNKDIVFNDDVKLSEGVSFENSRISFEEVRMWTRLKVKSDWGEIIIVVGLVLALLSAASKCIIANRK